MSDRHYRRLFETAKDGVLILDGSTGEIIDVNPSLITMVGYPRETLMGRKLWEAPSLNGLANCRSMFADLTEIEAVTNLGRTLEVADGRYIEVELIVDAYVLDGERLVQCSVRGLEARRRAEASMLASERRFLTMANSMSQLAWIAQPDGYIYWYNQRWYEYTGTTPEQMAGWGWQSVHDPEWVPHVISKWTEAIALGDPFEMEFPLRGNDGRFRKFLTRALPLKDADGQLTHWFGTNTDVEDLKRVEESLRRSEASLAAAQTRANIGSWEIDVRTQEVTCSAQLWRILGRDAAAGPRRVGDFLELHPDDLRAFTEKYARAMTLRSDLQHDARILLSDGSVRWIDIRGELVVDDAGQPERMVGTSQDITERKRAADEVHRLNAELEQRVVERTGQLESANKELDAFSYSVSHDLRAPLRAINGFARIVLEDYGAQLPEDGRKQLERIRRGGEQMGHLIDDLLAFSRLGRQPINGRPVETARLVKAVLEELDAGGACPNLEVSVGDLPLCYGDPALLKQVWTNLLSNAIKYSRERRPAVVQVGCDRGSERVFFVRDNGAGFDMRYAHRLFGVFQRLHRADQFEGTGVGLAIVHRIVGRHGGRVWAEAEEGRGAAFMFTLQEHMAT